MTPLPKHLEEMREQQAEIADTKDYSGCSDSGIVIGYRKGFNQAASILLKDMESMAKALENLEGHTIAHLQFPHKETGNLTVAIINAREALKIWREKYGESNELG